MGSEKRKLPESVRIVLGDESFIDDINDIKQGTGIYVAKDSEEQILKHLPLCCCVNGWIRLHDKTSSIYADIKRIDIKQKDNCDSRKRQIQKSVSMWENRSGKASNGSCNWELLYRTGDINKL